MMVASTLLFCSAQVAALHSVINVPGGAYYDPIYYPFDPPTIPNVITYANYGASGLGVGGIISGTFGLVYPYNSVYNYSADIDSLYAPNFTLEYSGTIATVMDSTNVFIGDGSVGPATDFYTSGFTSRISHGTVSHDGYEYSQQYTGLLELTPLGITDFISPFGDMGMQIIFDFDKQRIDFIAPNTNRNNSILSFFGGGDVPPILSSTRI